MLLTNQQKQLAAVQPGKDSSLPLEVTGAINSKTRRSSEDSDAPGAEGWEVRLSPRLLGERGHHRMTRMIHEILSFIS